MKFPCLLPLGKPTNRGFFMFDSTDPQSSGRDCFRCTHRFQGSLSRFGSHVHNTRAAKAVIPDASHGSVCCCSFSDIRPLWQGAIALRLPVGAIHESPVSPRFAEADECGSAWSRNDPPPDWNTVPEAAAAPARISAQELKELKELLDSGIITQEEFDAKKKQLLGL